jgi:hypothetical protein
MKMLSSGALSPPSFWGFMLDYYALIVEHLVEIILEPKYQIGSPG